MCFNDLVIFYLGKCVVRVERVYNNMDCMDKNFLFHFILQAILRLLNISVISLDFIVFFSRQNLPKQKMGCMS